jgi:hypothetical protein
MPRLRDIIKKTAEKISNPSDLEKAQMMENMDIEKFAKRAVDNSEIKKYILTALGGAAIGGTLTGAGTYLTSSPKDHESEEEFKKRRMGDSMVNSVAGMTLGAATPIVAQGINSAFINPEKSSIGSKIVRGATRYGLIPTAAAGATIPLQDFWYNKIIAPGLSTQEGAIMSRIKALRDALPIDDLTNKQLTTSPEIQAIEGGSALKNIRGKLDSVAKITGPWAKKNLARKMTNPAIAALLAIVGPFAAKKFDQAIST